MGSKTHVNGKNTAGTHTTVASGARAVIDLLLKTFPDIKIMNGVIQGHVKARSFSIKFHEESGGKKMVVTANNEKQYFYLYNAPEITRIIEQLVAQKKLRNYNIRIQERD